MKRGESPRHAVKCVSPKCNTLIVNKVWCDECQPDGSCPSKRQLSPGKRIRFNKEKRREKKA